MRGHFMPHATVRAVLRMRRRIRLPAGSEPGVGTISPPPVRPAAAGRTERYRLYETRYLIHRCMGRINLIPTYKVGLA
jgi:hypothetical protein